jgi:hypothetical protein
VGTVVVVVVGMVVVVVVVVVVVFSVVVVVVSVVVVVTAGGTAGGGRIGGVEMAEAAQPDNITEAMMRLGNRGNRALMGSVIGSKRKSPNPRWVRARRA